jgi:hypothetical protein
MEDSGFVGATLEVCLPPKFWLNIILLYKECRVCGNMCAHIRLVLSDVF